jgi:hypothetical protein
MNKAVTFTLVFLSCLAASAQQTLNNDAVIKLVKAGVSDSVIITTINASQGTYDSSPDGLIALKNAGASDAVVSAIVTRSNGAAPAPSSAISSNLGAAAPAGPSPASLTASSTPAGSANRPRVFMESKSSGNMWNAVRDQSMEMSKDFEQVCPEVRISINQQAADYTVALNHIEHGFARDNQIQVANRDGDLISKTKEGGSIKSGVKRACDLILADFAKK